MSDINFKKNYHYNWSKLGKAFRYILNYFGLALEKDWAYCDYMWVNALNHCAINLLDCKVDMKIKENLAELIVILDEDGTEFINEWYEDYKKLKEDDTKFTAQYIKSLKQICPLIEKYQKQCGIIDSHD